MMVRAVGRVQTGRAGARRLSMTWAPRRLRLRRRRGRFKPVARLVSKGGWWPRVQLMERLLWSREQVRSGRLTRSAWMARQQVDSWMNRWAVGIRPRPVVV